MSLIPLPKALELINKGQHTVIDTTDGRLALVPQDKGNLKVSSVEAVNLMFYVVRTSGADDLASARAQLDAALEKVATQGSEDEQTRHRMEKYRQIRENT